MQARSLNSQDGRVPPPPLQLPHQVQLPENEQLRCPRCDSTDTKFCYYNNYNLSQPRHFCRSCKRYWTRGGTLRNIPVGGSTRKNTKRGPSDDDSCSSAAATAGKLPASAAPGDHFVGGEGGGGDVMAVGRVFPPAGAVGLEGPFGNLADAGGSFTSLLGGAGGQFAGFGEGLPPGLQMVGDLYGEAGQNMDPLVMVDGFSGPDEEFLNMAGEEGEWPHLSMYPPGSSYM